MEYTVDQSAKLTSDRSGKMDSIVRLSKLAINALESLAPLLDLGIRLFVASIFFKAGLVKITSWSATLALFENEYNVPLLPPELAAYLGAGTELFFPVLLTLGLGTRFAAAVLFIFNIVAVISYPDLSAVGIKDHQYWGLLLLIPLLHGPGKLSADHFIRRKFFE